MRLPNGASAIVTDDKLLGYILNPNHPTNAGHAVLFRRLLGIDRGNPHLLRDALRAAAREKEAVPGKPSIYGQKYAVRFDMTGPRQTYTILSIWVVEYGQDIPRLVTAFVE